MRHLRFAILVAALSVCVGASECGGGSSSSSKISSASGSGAIGPRGSVSEGGDLVVPTPEPGGALLFGLGALIAAGATRRLEKRRS